MIFLKKIIICITCLILLTGCSNKKDNSSEDKLTSEIEYIGSEIINILHNLNNITIANYELTEKKFSMNEELEMQNESGEDSKASSGETNLQNKNNSSDEQKEAQTSNNISVTEMQYKSILNTNTSEVNWNKIKQEIETINTAWNILLIDLQTKNVDNIEEFSNTLNASIISIKNENKNDALTNLTTLYSFIPNYLKTVSNNKHTFVLEQTKYYILLAYSSVTKENWNDVTYNIKKAENSFIELLNDKEYLSEKKFKIDKTYSQIKDLQNAIPSNDKELFYLKYKNLIESLNTF